jgi:D-threo-aldose 1-dehydrogenase
MTQVELPPFGMGAAGIGNLYSAISDADALATVEAAWKGGQRYFDTAPYYGFGLSERRLGAALAALDPQQSAIVSTKVGRKLVPLANPARERHGFVDGGPFDPVFDYRRDAVLRSHDESHGRLRRDRVEILLAHDLGAKTHGTDAAAHMRDFLESGYPAMLSLRQQQAVDAIGIGVNETEVCALLLERVELDYILLAGRYTLLDQSALDHLFPLCLQKGVKVIAGGPYNSGMLARPTKEQVDPHYDYDVPPASVTVRARAVERVCDQFGISLPAAALHFPLRHPAVACVIAGVSHAAEAREGLDRIGTDIPDALWQALADQGLVRDHGAMKKAPAA